jgi:hypothetical protein
MDIDTITTTMTTMINIILVTFSVKVVYIINEKVSVR